MPHWCHLLFYTWSHMVTAWCLKYTWMALEAKMWTLCLTIRTATVESQGLWWQVPGKQRASLVTVKPRENFRYPLSCPFILRSRQQTKVVLNQASVWWFFSVGKCQNKRVYMFGLQDTPLCMHDMLAKGVQNQKSSCWLNQINPFAW